MFPPGYAIVRGSTLYDGLRHELFNEPSGPQVVADMVAWVDAQLSG